MPKLLSLSERKRRIACANDAKSRGPVTAAGKARSSRNEVKHGLRSTRLLSEEVPPGFEEMLQGFVRCLNPGNSPEFSLVAEIALSWHRVQQLWRPEAQAWRGELARMPELSGAAALAKALEILCVDGTLPILYRYEVANSNRMHRALRQLRDLRRAALQLRLRKAPVPNKPTTPLTLGVSAGSSPFDATARTFHDAGARSIREEFLPRTHVAAATVGTINIPVPNKPTTHSTSLGSAPSSPFAGANVPRRFRASSPADMNQSTPEHTPHAQTLPAQNHQAKLRPGSRRFPRRRDTQDFAKQVADEAAMCPTPRKKSTRCL